ncbi:MAG: DNA polymerase III subunit delta' [Xanthomonadales bacterium]|nr:DNA polymerase III subunit delta' [Xanthomonadales bacterium]
MSGHLAPWLAPAWQRFCAALAEDRLSHGVLLAGEPGLGKRLLADAMVARLLCERAGGDAPACGQCRGCTWRAAGSHPDLHRLAPEEDSKLIKVAQVRALIGRLQLTGQTGATRVALIDPADAMNAASQNALLKTLEEPPAGVIVLLLSDSPGRLLATVRSRCQTVAVVRPGPEQVAQWLAGQGVTVPALALALAGGHPATALAYADPDRARQAQAVAEDLQRLADGRAQPLAVAQRWASSPVQHVDDAIAWLRLWAWQGRGQVQPGPPPPSRELGALVASQAAAVQLRERLAAPLRALWLLHEWLEGWRTAR